MRKDSFEHFGKYKDLVNGKLIEFILEKKDLHKKEKDLFHYQSTINVSIEIIRYNNSEADKLKDLLVEYFDIVKDIDFSIDEKDYSLYSEKRKESLKLYNKYLEPIGSYLLENSEFGVDLPVGVYLFLGIIIDSVIYFNFEKSIVPLMSILILIFGIKMKNKKQREGKTIRMFK